ncbi:MAG: CCA tRNA nucleotidyltransferase, mitochondrial [Trizodia sp. TS-e1964]|nr:MAG: CCA tRNA nucleotidyltransferase, mitochondrial [Trizodia sp. TS-e1964]
MAEVGRVDTKNWRAAYSCVSQCTCDQTDFVSPEIARNFAIVKSVLFIDSEDEYLSWMISALAPWLDHPSMDPTSKSELSIAVVSARTALKLSNKVCEVIGGAFAHFREVISMKDTFNQQLRPTAASPSKQVVGCDELGMMIRLWGRNWRSYVMLAMIREAVDHYVHRRELSGKFALIIAVDKLTITEFYLIIESYAVFLGHIKEQGLIEAWNFKPVVNGKELARALGVKPGPWTGAALNMVMEWQLRNPDSTDSSGALEEVKSRVDELALP